MINRAAPSTKSNNKNPCMPGVWKLGEVNSVVTVESSDDFRKPKTYICKPQPLGLSSEAALHVKRRIVKTHALFCKSGWEQAVMALPRAYIPISTNPDMNAPC